MQHATSRELSNRNFLAGPDPRLGDSVRAIHPQSISPSYAPEFILGRVSPDVLRFYANEIWSAQVSCYVFKDVGVSGEGFIVRDGKFVALPENYLNCDVAREGQRRGVDPFPKSSVIEVGEAVLAFGPGYEIYGHWLVDYLPRLTLLQDAAIDARRVRYILPNSTPQFALHLLQLLGISSDQLVFFDPQTQWVAASRLIVPTNVRSNSRASPYFATAVSRLIEMLAQAGNWPAASANERLFVSRGTRGGRVLANRAEIEAMFRADGFAVIVPEEMPLVEQFALFQGASIIAGEYGSGLHASMFSNKGTRVCCLRESRVHPGFLQSGICQALGQRVSYIFGPPVPAQANEESRFLIDPPDVAIALRLLRL
jgi:capsular polysaccharide biosynthesis protein